MQTRSAIGRFLAVALASAGCDAGALPGTQLGTYSVTARAQSDTCGMAQDPWTFDIQMSRTASTLYWSWLDARAPVSGTFEGVAVTTLTARYQLNVDETADGGLGPCWLERDDDVALTLAAGAIPATFSGSLTFAYSVVPGADCTDQLASSSGTYATLPCSMAYSLSGARK